MKRFIAAILCFIIIIPILTVPATASHDSTFLPSNDGLIKNSYGVHYSCTDGTYHISGTPLKSSYLNLWGDSATIPENLQAGDRLRIHFQSGTAYVKIGFFAFSKTNPNGTWLMKTSTDTEFVVPDLSNYTGISIRILVSQCDRNFNLTVSPVIEIMETILPSNNGLTKNVFGIKYSCTDGTYHISGTPLKSSFLNLCGDAATIPENLQTGDRLKIRFQSGTEYVKLGFFAFSKTNPNGTWLMKTSADTTFVIPDLSDYTGISIRILVTQCNRNFNLKITPIIEKENLPDDVVLPSNSGLTKVSGGIRYSCTDGTYHISGTPQKSSYLDLNGGVYSVPANLKKDDRLKIQFHSGTAYVALGLYAFYGDSQNGTWLMKTSTNTEFVVPDLSDYTGVSIRLLVSQCNRNFDLKLTPIIEKEEPLLPSNDGLTKSSYGINYSCNNGTYHISGTPQKTSFITLNGGVDSIPKGLKKGDRLKIKFQSDTAYVTFGIYAFPKEGSTAVWLLKTSRDADFVVPDLSEYKGVSIRLLVSQCDRQFDLEVTPAIEKVENPKSYLTIIDDDGDTHFLTDLYPLIQELQVPISSAVTTTRIGTSARWMDWDDIAYLDRNGVEILNHTYSHFTGSAIESVDDATIYNNYKKSRDELLRRGIHGGNYLIYSSSTGNSERVQRIAGQLFDCGVKIGGSTINTAETNPFALSRYRIDYAGTEGRTDWNLDDMKSFVREVAFDGGWQIWMIHTSNSLWRQRVCLDESGNVLYENGAPIPMVDENNEPVLDSNGIYPTMGKTVYIPMLREAILYAQARDVEIVSVDTAYRTLYK